MVHYDTKILSGLLDSYENSLLSRSENKVNIHIAFPFTKKTLPEYFNESSLVYDEIHAVVKELERKGFLSVVWKKGKEGHIIQKVILKEEQIKEVYSYLNRTPKSDHVNRHLQFFTIWEQEQKETLIAAKFVAYLKERIEDGKSVKEFIDLSDLEKTKELLELLSLVENNKETCYIREFSIRHFADSKIFESQLGVLGKIMRRFKTEFANMDIYQILAEYNIYNTPDYVYIKGEGELSFHKGNQSIVDLFYLEQGIGISGADVKNIRVSGKDKVKRVITIENLTAFFRWQEKDSLMIYLGGYHNSVRRELLNRVYQELPEAEYLHFGDIDVGGFEIYRDLCEKTGIPFQTYHMGIWELEHYKDYTKKLTENDKKRLQALMKKEWFGQKNIAQVLEYMEENNRKLEQEIVRKIQ
ncbi:MAG: hypothetical protein HFI76_06455 [Lachnospiraceae bacterium]|nr:hypothetical protein [Lachnospiraceae bacterium]